MRARRAVAALALIGAAPLPAPAPAPAFAPGTVMIDIANVRDARGIVHVDLCPEDRFLKEDCPYRGNAPARAGVITIAIRGVPAGRYAAQAFHDENANGKVDRALFGVPREGVGFSRDARILLGPPKWSDAVFTTSGREDHIAFKLRYFLGPSGPRLR